MTVQSKLGNTATFSLAGRSLDVVEIEWFEANKRMWHKRSAGGRDIALRALNHAPQLTDGDVLWCDDKTAIVVEIKPCEAIVHRPASLQQMASVCYEIGNKHLPLFYSNGELLIPFDAPLHRMLLATGNALTIEMRKLTQALATSVEPHGPAENKPSLFSRILTLTTS